MPPPLDESDRPSPPANFIDTQWSLVLRSAQGDASGRDALEQLCRLYWPPLVAHLRRRGLSRPDAEDQVQGFFQHLLHKEALPKARRERGRFRSFLLAALQNHTHHSWEKSQAAKRGGPHAQLAWDEATEAILQESETHNELTPDEAYDRAWALTLLHTALQRLEITYTREGRRDWFLRLRPFLQGTGTPSDYPDIAAELGVSRNAIAVAVHRLHARYAGVLRAVVNETVVDPAETEEELGYLLRCLQRP